MSQVFASISTIEPAKVLRPLNYGVSGVHCFLPEDIILRVGSLILTESRLFEFKHPYCLENLATDFLRTVGAFFSAEGKYIQAYLQDTYLNWSYEENSKLDGEYIPNDHFLKTEGIVKCQEKSPFIKTAYIPKAIWYVPINTSGWGKSFFTARKKTHHLTRPIKPNTKIADLSRNVYSSQFRKLLQFSGDNKHIHDVITWYKLDSVPLKKSQGFWVDYTNLERRLGFEAISICVNKNAISRELSVIIYPVKWLDQLEQLYVDSWSVYWYITCSFFGLTGNCVPSKTWGLYRWFVNMKGVLAEIRRTASQSILFAILMKGVTVTHVFLRAAYFKSWTVWPLNISVVLREQVYARFWKAE